MLWMRVFTSTQIEGFTDEVLGARLQRTQLVARLCREHDDRQVGVRRIRLQAFHHLEAIHGGHLQVEQNQVITVLSMQGADFERLHRRAHVAIPGLLQHAREQLYVGALIVDDQNVRGKNVLGIDH